MQTAESSGSRSAHTPTNVHTPTPSVSPLTNRRQPEPKVAVAGPAIGRRDAEAADRWRRPHLSAARGISSAVKLLAPSAFLTRNGKERFLGLCSSSGSLVPHMARRFPVLFVGAFSAPFGSLHQLPRWTSSRCSQRSLRLVLVSPSHAFS